MDAIVTKSIILVLFGFSPPPNTPRVEFESAPVPFLTSVKSPKSVAFPVVDVVTNSIVLTLAGATYPKLNTVLVEEEHPDPEEQISERSPKSTAFAAATKV